MDFQGRGDYRAGKSSKAPPKTPEPLPPGHAQAQAADGGLAAAAPYGFHSAHHTPEPARYQGHWMQPGAQFPGTPSAAPSPQTPYPMHPPPGAYRAPYFSPSGYTPSPGYQQENYQSPHPQQPPSFARAPYVTGAYAPADPAAAAPISAYQSGGGRSYEYDYMEQKRHTRESSPHRGSGRSSSYDRSVRWQQRLRTGDHACYRAFHEFGVSFKTLYKSTLHELYFSLPLLYVSWFLIGCNPLHT